MKLAYADPPYIGKAEKHYGEEAREVNHELLVNYLVDSFDGWALSCSSPSLEYILSICPDSVRIGAWVKPFCIFKPYVNPAYAWEPVIFYGGRDRTREQFTVRDWVSCNITLEKGLVGVKPPKVCYWIFQVLNAQPGDELEDLFPGSGAVTEAWQGFMNNLELRQERLD